MKTITMAMMLAGVLWACSGCELQSTSNIYTQGDNSPLTMLNAGNESGQQDITIGEDNNSPSQEADGDVGDDVNFEEQSRTKNVAAWGLSEEEEAFLAE